MKEIVTPIAIVNFKAYESAIGKNAVKLAKAIEAAAKKSGKSVAICVTASDLAPVRAAVSIPIFVEHSDAVEPGAHTGTNLLESSRDWGADGILINHAEDQMCLASIDFVINKARRFGLKSLVCSSDVSTTRAIAAMNPDVVAVEPPEFIGTNISVTKADPSVVSDAVEAVKKFDKIPPKAKVLCGAGIKTAEDVSAALKLGSDGILLASKITKAKDPEAAMSEILRGL